MRKDARDETDNNDKKFIIIYRVKGDMAKIHKTDSIVLGNISHQILDMRRK